ncbi:MAG: glycine cleavage system aminomethyltransferase GcvT [Flavobacteriales bacterium]|nr:glycine cleavage system aminomethyltransferase GcvT [Flavobacteriales bacterium]
MNAAEETKLIRTSLYDQHGALQAKMVPFAGYSLPVSYAGLAEEHHAVRTACGMFDVSHMGEFRLKGPGAIELIQWISSNDAAKLSPGQVQYSCIPNGKGGIIDDLLVYCVNQEEFMLVVNASNRTKDWEWIHAQNRWKVQLTDESDDWTLIAVQGPHAASMIQPLSNQPDLDQMKYYTFQEGRICGHPCIISATGYTGAGGFELYVRHQSAPEIWKALLDAGVVPCGLGARDTLRLEAGFCLYGNDIDETTSPIEAGLGWITKFNKDFVDREYLLAQKEQGTDRVLRGFKMLERGIPRQGYTIENTEGDVIGHITSGTQSPTLGEGIAMGYIQKSQADLGNQIRIRIRKNTVAAQIVRPGFLPKS